MPAEKVLIVSSFTAQPLRSGLAHWSDALGLELSVSFAVTQQVFQLLLDPASEAASHDGVTVLMVRIEDIVSSSLQAKDLDDGRAIERGIEELVSSIRIHAANPDRCVLVLVCPPSPEFLQRRGWPLLHQAEARLWQEYLDHPQVSVIGSRRLLEDYPITQYHDALAYREGFIPYTAPMFTALATAIARFLHARNHSDVYKLVVVDCDNTLWTGVCGEIGHAGVIVDDGRRALQEALVEQARLGRLVCLCSRNNESDVWSVFDHHPQMLLRREHLASWRINWRPKHENLHSLAEELSLGLQSMVYLDDDAATCSEIESLLPNILTLHVPEDSHKIPRFVAHIWAFDKVVVTAEDRQRVAQYQQERTRRELQSNCASYEEFLQNLNVSVRVTGMEPGEAQRVAQLMIRTTQFNSCALHFSERELKKVVDAGSVSCSTIRVTDRFGDYGLAGFLLYQVEGPCVLFRALALSCRVLGRGVEPRVLEEMKRITASRGCREMQILYQPTARNVPVREFLEGSGFQRVAADEKPERFQYCVERLSENACAIY